MGLGVALCALYSRPFLYCSFLIHEQNPKASASWFDLYQEDQGSIPRERKIYADCPQYRRENNKPSPAPSGHDLSVIMVTSKDNFSLPLIIIIATNVGIKHLPFRKTKFSKVVVYDNGNCQTDIEIQMKLYSKVQHRKKSTALVVNNFISVFYW